MPFYLTNKFLKFILGTLTVLSILLAYIFTFKGFADYKKAFTKNVEKYDRDSYNQRIMNNLPNCKPLFDKVLVLIIDNLG